MIKGRAVSLTKAKQAALATWSAKTTMMLQYVHRKQDQYAIPYEDYVTLFQEKQPSDIMRVWTAFMVPPTMVFTSVENPVEFLRIPLNADMMILNGEGIQNLAANAYVATLRIGHLVMQVIRIKRTGLLFNLTPSPGLGRCIVSVWPAVGMRQWPPAPLDTIGGFSSLANALAAPTGK